MSISLLFVSHVNPFVLDEGASLRAHHLLKAFSKHCDLICLAIIPRELQSKENNTGAEKICKAYFEWDRLSPKPLRSLMRFKPTETSSFYSEDYRNQFQEITRRYNIDVVWLDHVFLFEYLYGNQSASIPTIVDAHNIESAVYKDKSRLHTSPILKLKYLVKWKIITGLEKKIARETTCLVAVSEQDRSYYASLHPPLRTFIVQSCIDFDYYANSPAHTILLDARPMLLYTGVMKYEATHEGALYFYHQVMPHLDKLLPDYRFYVVGKDPVKEVRAIAGPKVVVTGFVESTLPYFRSADVFIVPLLHGSGTRLKILEAMASGVPVVSTSKGCEGLEVEDNKHLLIADSPHEFAERVCAVWKDPDLRRRLVSHARELVRAKYDWRSLEAPLKGLLATAMGADRHT